MILHDVWQWATDAETCRRVCLTLGHSLWIVGILAAAARLVERSWRSMPPQRGYALNVAALVASLVALPTTYVLLAPPRAATPLAADTVDAVAEAAVATPTGADDVASGIWAPAAGGGVGPHGDGTDVVAVGEFTDSAIVANATRATNTRWAWAPWLAGAYTLGVGAMLVRLSAGIVSAERMRRKAEPLAGPTLAALQKLTSKWQNSAIPALARVERLAVPTLVGFLKPTILLPSAALAGLTAAELELILAHELAHVRRRDLWVNLVQRLAEAVLFFNPALWLLSRRISTLREFCCDDWACATRLAARANVRLDYAAALVRIVELAAPRRVGAVNLAALAASGRAPSELRRRIARLVGEPLREPLGLSRGALVAIGAIVLTLAIAPAWLHSQPAAEAPAADDDGDAVAEAAATELPEFPGPKTEADEIVAAARARTFGLRNTPRIRISYSYWNGTVPSMDGSPEKFDSLFAARGREADAKMRAATTSTITVAWGGDAIVTHSAMKPGDVAKQLISIRAWDGREGWWRSTTREHRSFGRYATLAALMESTNFFEFPYVDTTGGRVPWSGAEIKVDEYAVDPELTRYARAGEATIDGVACDVYEGPARMERLWIDKATGLIKAASRSYARETLPNYNTELVADVAGRTFASDDEYRQWYKAQPQDVQARISAHWSAAHWPESRPGNLAVYSDHREIVPGVHWPMRCERMVVHPAYGDNKSRFYLNDFAVTETTDDFAIDELLAEAMPRAGDKITDWRSTPVVEYVWSDALGEEAIEAERQAKRTAKEQAEAEAARINATPIESVADAIHILTDGPTLEPTMIWARAIKYLVDHKDEGLPAAIAQLDAETRDHAISKLAFALRAMDDPRAVPALIRALPRTLLPGRSDFGLLLQEDLELLRFMQRSDQQGRERGDAKGHFNYGRAFREVTSALHRLTKQEFGEIELNWLNLRGTANQRRLKMQQMHAATERWAAWWDEEGHTLVDDPAYATVNLPELAIEVGTPLGYDLPAGQGVRLMSGPSGGIIESVHDSGKRCFVDLDTQREAGWPEELGPFKEADFDSPEVLEWARREGFDVLGITHTPPEESEPLYCLKPLGMRAWKITADEHKRLDEAIEGHEPYPLSRPVELMVPQRAAEPPLDQHYGGDAFLFVTREGTAGLLRITAQVTEIGGSGYASDPQFATAGVHRGARVSLAWMNEEAR